ncbi:hypothetical protein EML15_09815 [Corynebacterium sp. sy017]|uniref:DUF7507 domain-containing protein n=1 Tax=unclassified Corynebacterium TaxID=2624378 RepID=UPI001184F13F|nr:MULTISPECIES: hypothetical protein [unclassified Corynebacterium]MBP3089434.1 hypothetical protein [Corynebacterium sp. sy017]TSD90881.1 hypothetical protein ELY17_08785 [Corynebacterium sp. SY003]
MGKKHWLLRRIGVVMMTTGLLSSGMWGGASSGVGVPVVWAADETTAPAADTASGKQLPDSVIKNMTVTTDPDNKDKVVLTVDFAFPDDAKTGDYIDVDLATEVEGSSPKSAGFQPLHDALILKDPVSGKIIATAVSASSGYRVTLQPESEGLINRTAQLTRTAYIPTGECERDAKSLRYTATTVDSQGNNHEWDLYTTVERDGGKCNTNTNPIPRGTIVGMPIPVMACSTRHMLPAYVPVTDSSAKQGAGVYGSATGDVYVTPPIGDVGGENETFQDIYVRVRVDEAQTPMKMVSLHDDTEVNLNSSSASTRRPGFASKNGGWKPGDLDTKYPSGTPVPPQAYVYPPDFDLEGVKAKAQPGTNGLSESFDWNSKTITQEDADALDKLFAEAFKTWQEAHKPEIIGSNDDPANGTVYVDYKIPGLGQPVIMKNAWGEDVASLQVSGTTTRVDESGNASANVVADVLSKSSLYSIGLFGSRVFAPYSGAAEYNTILTYSTDPESYKSSQGHIENSAHYGSCGDGGAIPLVALEGVAHGDPLQAKPVPRVSVDKMINGEGANEAPGIAVAEDEKLSFRFMIRNSGNTVLKNLRLADDKIPADKITCGSSSLDTVVLQPAEEVTCRASLDGLKPGEQHTNLATVTATPVDKDGNPVDGGDVTTQDPANAHGAAPGVELVKKINAVDANTTEDAVVVDADSDMNIMFEVTNTGDMPLKDIVVSDDVITDPSKITCPGRPETLDPGAKLTCYATLPAPQAGEMHTNTGTVTATPVDKDGNPVGDTPLTDSDPANARVPEATPTTSSSAPSTTSSSAAPSTTSSSSSSSVEPTSSSSAPTSSSVEPAPSSSSVVPVPEPKVVVPGIGVVKKINGDDADTAPGVVIASDADTMTVSFEVTNTGEAPLKDVTVTDDQITDAQAIVCADKPAVLQPKESFTCTATVPAPGAGQTHKDTATVKGVPVYEEGTTGPAGEVTGSNPAHAHKPKPRVPGVKVVKKINGDDANREPGVAVKPGESLNISFEVSNTGETPLKDVTVSDDQIKNAQDIVCENKPEVLAPGESFTCTATLPAPSSGVTHKDTATVTGTPVDEEGHPVGDTPVRDDDSAFAWLDEPAKVAKIPSIKVMKKINDDDANVAPGVKVAPGSDMKVSFEVTNDGSATLENINLTDNVIPADQITCANKPESLKPGQSFTCSATLKAPATGDHVNIATVEGTPVYGEGESGPTSPVLDVDPARAWVDEPVKVAKVPSVKVIKSINGDDANAYPGVGVAPGSDMSISFEVTNDGDVALDNINLTDNVIPADQITCANKPDTLNPGESFTCQATLKAPVSGKHVNIASVEGTPVYGDGESGPTSPVSDVDPARAWVDEPQKEVKKPSITVVKKINDEDANTKPGVKVQPGEDMDIVFEVTNTGTATLGNVTVSDNVIPADQITCDNKPETLAPGQSFTCQATLKAPVSGDHVNIATVEGTPVYGDGETGSDSPVRDSDEANAWVDEPQKEVKKPSIHVMKKINGDDANSKPGVRVQPGSDMDIVFEVTNTGTATLENVTVSDNVIPADHITCENKPETLKPGQSFTCHATLKAPSSGDHVNIATVEGTPVYGEGETGSDQPVKDVDEANAWVDVPDATVMNPSITVVKKINDDDANTKPGVKVSPGEDMNIVFEVTNDGDVALENIDLTDNVVDAKGIMCEDKPDTLNPGDSFTCTATLAAPLSGDHVNIATVEATPVYAEGESGPEGPVKDSDVARAWVDEPEKVVKVPSITVVKKINGDDANSKPGVKVQPGEDMNIVFEVTNTGSAVLESIDLSDNVIPSDQITCEDKPESLAPGESFTCHAILKAPVSGDHVNIATAQATPIYGDGETGSEGPVLDVDVARAVVVEPDQPEQPESDKPESDKPAKPVESEADKPAKPSKSESSKPAGSCGESVGAKPACGTPSKPESSKPAEPVQSGGVIAGEVVKHCQKPTNPTNPGDSPAQSGTNPAESGEPVKAEPAADKTAKTVKAGVKTNTGGKTQKSGVRVTTGGHLAA